MSKKLQHTELLKKEKTVELSKHNVEDLEVLAVKMGYDRDYKTLFENRTGRNIMNFILKTDYSLSWKEHKLYSAKKYYELIGEEKNRKSFLDEAQGITQIINDNYLKNEMSERQQESWLSQEQLTEIRERFKDYEDEDGMYSYLILSMITMQPPLRPEAWAKMYFATKEKDVEKTGDKNYIYCSNSKTPKGYYYLNKDKVSNTPYFSKEIKKSISLSTEFVEVVKMSKKKFPREKVFDFRNNKNEHIKEVEDKLRKILNKATCKKFGFSNARASYRTYHVKPTTTTKERHELADKMRHSNEVAESVYTKVDGLDPNYLTDEQSKNRIADLESQLTDRDKKIAELEKYIQGLRSITVDIVDTNYDKKRYDIISSANKKGFQIKKANQDRYNINFNDASKLWE